MNLIIITGHWTLAHKNAGSGRICTKYENDMYDQVLNCCSEHPLLNLGGSGNKTRVYGGCIAGLVKNFLVSSL